MLAKPYDAIRWSDVGLWRLDSCAIEDQLHKVEAVRNLGLSGAQVGAAKMIAALLYRDGPRGVMRDEHVKDRHILVSKNFPGS